MNRLTKAWKALRGTLEPEVVIADSAAMRTIYSVGGYGWGGKPTHYATCQQAHEESPGREVRAGKALFIEGQLYWVPWELRKVELQPKPKRPKGKASA